MSRGPDAGTLVCRALARAGTAAGCAVEVDATDMTRWVSATFTGARHRIAVHGETGEALEEWLAGLAEAELPLRGHLVADLAVVAVHRRGAMTAAMLEALTVET